MTASSPQPVSPATPRRFGGVQLGGMLFTLVEPWRGRQVDYNRWYEGDHFYATVLGPGVLAGRRFVATAQLKATRDVGDGLIVPSASVGSYLALYWMTDTAAFNAWGAANTRSLHEAGRIFVERDHIHTLMYDLESWVGRDAAGVSPELALDHPFAFVVVEILTDARAAQDESGDLDFTCWIRTDHAPRVIDSGAELVLSFRPVPLLDAAPADVPHASGMDGARLLLHFHTGGSPEDAMATLAAGKVDLERNGQVSVRFRSPFVPAIPGTDCYTDALW
jgi:hypothetical protein